MIHTVGPFGERPDKLTEAYQNSLKEASRANCKSIAFPCISTGVYRYPPKSAAETAIRTVQNYLEHNKDIERVVFCVFTEDDEDIYRDELKIYQERTTRTYDYGYSKMGYSSIGYTG